MNTQHQAYLHGFITKLAEYNVSPAAFYEAALRSGEPTLTKVAMNMRQGLDAAGNIGDIAMQMPANVAGLLPNSAKLQQAWDDPLANVQAIRELSDRILAGASGAAGLGAGAAGGAGAMHMLGEQG